MKKITTILFCALALWCQAQDLRATLIKQLKSTHTDKDWFVPINVAVEGLTADQANWKDGSGNHSVAQLLYHLVFWNDRALKEFKGEKNEKFSGNNEETFDKATQQDWNTMVKKIDDIMKGWEQAVASADEKKLKDAAGTIANVSTHNAYHTGQIVFVRKLQGVWNPEKGVK